MLVELHLLAPVQLGDDGWREVLLHEGLGERLTSLVLMLDVGFKEESGILEVADRVLKLCPSLTRFAFFSPSTSSLFGHLPASLQSLELGIYPHSTTHKGPITPSDDLMDYLISPNVRRRLQRVVLSVQGPSMDGRWEDALGNDAIAAVTEGCHRASVELCWADDTHCVQSPQSGQMYDIPIVKGEQHVVPLWC